MVAFRRTAATSSRALARRFWSPGTITAEPLTSRASELEQEAAGPLKALC
jgi:hypothetical protein